MEVKVEYKGFTTIKIKRTGELITLTLPAFFKAFIAKLPEDQEIEFSAGTVLKGLGQYLEKFKE